MAKPYVNQPVLYYPARCCEAPLAGVICKVWSDKLVNVAFWDENGRPLAHTSVPFEPNTDSDDGYCTSMPSPEAAKKHEAAPKGKA